MNTDNRCAMKFISNSGETIDLQITDTKSGLMAVSVANGWHVVVFCFYDNHKDTYMTMYQWLNENVNRNDWNCLVLGEVCYNFLFRNELDAMGFKLRWV